MSELGTVIRNFKGLDVFPKGKNVNVRAIPSTTGKIVLVVQKGQRAGQTTGNVLKMRDGEWWQIDIGNKVLAYVRNDVATAVKSIPLTITDTKNVIEKLVETDKKVFDVLNRVQLFLIAAKAKGKNTSTYDSTFNALSNRFAARQNEIKNSTVLKWQVGLKQAYEKSKESYIKTLMQTNGDAGMFMAGLGALPAVVVVSVVFGVGLSVAAYFLFKPKYDESTKDLKVSTDLENLLKQTDPATSTKIKNDLEKQIDTAYNSGKTEGTFGGIFSMLKPIALMGLGFWVVTKFINKNK